MLWYLLTLLNHHYLDQKNPYYVLTEVCGRSFNKVDNLLKEVRKDLIDSDERCEAVV